jgi:Tfp pilus assembly protein PilF
MSYLAKRDYVKARIELRNALQLNGKMIEAWRALSQIAEHNNNVAELAGSLRRIAELDDKDVRARVLLAKLELTGNAPDQALQMINEAVALTPKNAEVLAIKAAILLKLRNTDAATQAADNALKLDPDNADAIMVLASEKYLRGDNAGALDQLSKITGARKNNVSVLLLKVNIYEHSDNLRQEEITLQQLVTLYPKESIFRTFLVKFYLTHNRPDDAEKELRTVAASNPNDISAELELVDLLSTIKGPGAARAELVARINAGGNIFPYQIALAKLDFSQGNAVTGESLLKKLETSTNHDDALTAKITLAQLYMGKNDIAAAEPLVKEILAVDSRNTEGLALRAAIRLNRGQIEDAIADLRTALNDQPRSPVLLANLALAYERGGSIELADKAFQDAMQESNYAPTFGLNYLAFLQRRGLASQAESTLQQLVQHNPTNITILSALAKSKLAQHDWGAAENIAATIRQLDKKSIIADQITGAALIGQHKLNESVVAFLQAYDQDPSAQSMAILVTAYLHAGETAKAEALLQKALKTNPHNASALVLLGSVQIAKNDLSQSESDFKAAITEQPTNPAGYQALAKLYAMQNKPDEAIQVVRNGLKKQPKNFELGLTLAGLLEQVRNYKGAIEEYRLLLKDQPGSLIVANNLASLLSDHPLDKASLDEARALAALLKASPIPQFQDTRGWVEYQQGDDKAAISTLEEAAAKLPNVALVHYHLGMAYLAVGEAAKAADQFKTARKLSANDPDLQTKIDAAQSGKNKS